MIRSAEKMNMGATEAVVDLARFRSQAIETLELPFFFFDMAGTVTYANAGACQALGYSAEELVGTGISDLDTALSEDMWHQISESICGEKSLNYESHLYHRDGRVIPYEFRFQYFDAGKAKFISALAFDIADRKSVEGDILAARETALENAAQLEEKTRIAEEALARVNQLKVKQDGDYYLTSLLLQPFQMNRARRQGIHVDWLVRQKTQFTYRKWHSEIGGDFCSAETITLMGREYTLFVIADAMGKANQGASGALILATIISTYVSRTRKTQQLGGLFPERWLRLLFDELHAGFEGFEGLMMMSVAFGLVDEASHVMYFVNAEQPRPVSYHNGTASYIGSLIPRPKIGMPGVPEQVSIELYQLRQGETIIFGSDGRDDIRLYSENVINHDEELFLDLVLAAKADLPAIRRETEKVGEIIDDYSLLSVRLSDEKKSVTSKTVTALLAYYRENQDVSALDSVLVREPNHAQALASLANYFLKAGEAERSIEYLRRYSDMRPRDLKAIYALVVQFCRLKDYKNAADIGERITYRVHEKSELALRSKILSLLAVIYRKLENPRLNSIRDKIAAENSG